MPKKIAVLTGASEHDWQRASKLCGQILEETGHFEVCYYDNPSLFLSHRDGIKDFDLFVVIYNGLRWGQLAEDNFIEAVKNGCGVVILHSTNNGFKGWSEFESLCALMWRRETQIINGNTYRVGTGHGTYHNFDIVLTDLNHPITQGLPKILQNHPDELYHNLKHMHDAPYHVIATAYSSPEQGGTGKHEPVVFVRNYGKGRIFHTTLGHTWPGEPPDSLQSTAFKLLLVRGSKWAVRQGHLKSYIRFGKIFDNMITKWILGKLFLLNREDK